MLIYIGLHFSRLLGHNLHLVEQKQNIIYIYIYMQCSFRNKVTKFGKDWYGPRNLDVNMVNTVWCP